MSQSYFEVFILGLSLSLDAMAVAITLGLCEQKLRWQQGCQVAGLFGFFQGLMPLLGYFLGQALKQWIQPLDHWLAFLLLGLIGGKMVKEGLTALRHPQAVCCPADSQVNLSWRRLLILALATSIDALAAGISLPLLHVPVLPAVTLIALITFALAAIGLYFGRFFAASFRSLATLSGGVLLILIGLKIVGEHLSNGI